MVYGSTTPSVCSVTGTNVAIAAAGTCTLTANQPGDASWGPAAQQTQSFTIARAGQTLTFPAQSAGSRDFAPGGTFAIDPQASSASPNSGQSIGYSSVDPGVCSVAGTTVTMIAPGACSIAADQAGDANHEPADRVTATVQLVESTDADLAVSQLTDVTQARVGDTVGFTVIVENRGPQDAIHVNVLNPPSADLDGVVWFCTATIGAECPDPSSDLGGIDVTMDLPADAIVYFELLGTVSPDALQHGAVENTASVSLPAGSPVTDPLPGNNTASASVSIVSDVVHVDGFESPPPP